MIDANLKNPGSLQELSRRSLVRATRETKPSDDELDDHFDINEYSVVEKLNFIDLNEVKLKEQFLRADLKRRGSAYLIFLASEIVHRVIFTLIRKFSIYH